RQAPARWSATLQPRWGAPGDDRVRSHRRSTATGTGRQARARWGGPTRAGRGPDGGSRCVATVDPTRTCLPSLHPSGSSSPVRTPTAGIAGAVSTSGRAPTPPTRHRSTSMTENDPTANWSFETKQIHVGQSPDAATKARALPIYQTTSYTFDSTEHAEALFSLAEPGNIYTRIMNPTVDAVEQRIAALEGGVAALLLASGQSATTFAILNIVEAGDHIVSSPRLYGGTYNLFHYTPAKLGVAVSFVADPDDPESWRAEVRPNTKALFGETIGNPRGDVLDLEGISAVAKDAGVPLIVDNTVATPYLINPIAHGANIVVHSATKYIGGHGNSIAG